MACAEMASLIKYEYFNDFELNTVYMESPPYYFYYHRERYYYSFNSMKSIADNSHER